MNRRELIGRVLAGSTFFVLPSVLISCVKNSSSDIGGVITPGTIELELSSPSNSVLNNTGGWLIVQNIIVINTGGGNYYALSSICTHQGCTVEYNKGTGKIQCPCHGSVYSISGSVLNGPAPLPLQSFPISLAGDILTITY